MLPADVTAVAALAADEPTAPHWPAFEYQRMLEVTAESSGRRGAWVLAADEDLAGFAMAAHVAGVCELEAVVVASTWRGRRLAELLVRAVASWGRTLGAQRLELEVRVSNAAALRLYQRLGFEQDGVRARYYQNPEEDAWLMGLTL